jgi:hypothetical protein
MINKTVLLGISAVVLGGALLAPRVVEAYWEILVFKD